MILVTLGTQDKKFYRLLEEIDNLLIRRKIKDKVIVQAGSSSHYKCKSKKMQIFSLIPMEEFDKLIKECSLLITHGGVGTILAGLKNKKKVIAVPRLAKYKEHVNDHQVQIVSNFSDEEYLLKVENIKTLWNVMEYSKVFKPKEYVENNENFLKILEKEIDKYLV